MGHSQYIFKGPNEKIIQIGNVINIPSMSRGCSLFVGMTYIVTDMYTYVCTILPVIQEPCNIVLMFTQTYTRMSLINRGSDNM